MRYHFGMRSPACDAYRDFAEQLPMAMPDGRGPHLDEAEGGADPLLYPQGNTKAERDGPQRTQVVHWKGGK
jgi:hypothetical protein